MIVAQPRISTTVVTLMVTWLSYASIFLFTYSATEAMRHLLWRPMTLVQISPGIALVNASGRKYRMPILTLLTLFVFGVTKLLVNSWTTLLVPTLVSCYYDLDGTELSITSPAFSQLLAIELSAYAPTIIHDDSFPTITVGGSVSGISVAGAGSGIPGIIKFNQAKYNISTGGLLPVIESFAGSKIPPGANGTRMQFSGGRTLVNSTISGRGSSSSPRDWLGMQRNFSVYQQGITADIHCQTADASSQVLNFTNSHTTLNLTSPGSMSPAYKLVAWDSKADCNTSSIATQQYVTWGDASGQPGVAGTGFLPTIVCPGHKDPSDVYSRFVIASQGFYKYNFLPSTICEVTPLITTTRVDYTDGGIINASQILSTQTFSPNDTYLLIYLAGVVNYCARDSQGLTNNIIGDRLYSVHSGEFNTPISNNTDVVYRQLEDYWRGVIEFSATFLRAGYSAQGAFQDGIPSNMTSPLNGTMSTVTMGWANRGPIYIFSILPLGIVTLLTAMAAIYSLSQSRKERHDPWKQTSFDTSDTLRLIMASAEGGLARNLYGFDKQGLIGDDKIKVELTELKDNRKNLDVVKEAPFI
ncbi:hypothetical protein BDN67DRAFT_127483 [Paxillus ammoniavirescens]|nr:hypothetical protein BDN67DRAFT_127483 [Paxillus ammoniavirescens]